MPLNCQQARDLLGSNLSAEDHELLDGHLSSCISCAQFVDECSEENAEAIDGLLLQANSEIFLSPHRELKVGALLRQPLETTARSDKKWKQLVVSCSVATLAGTILLILGTQFLRSRSADSNQSQAKLEMRGAQPEVIGPVQRSAELVEPPVIQKESSTESQIRPAVIARDGYLVAETVGDEDDIPFFFVAPAAKSAVDENDFL